MISELDGRLVRDNLILVGFLEHLSVVVTLKSRSKQLNVQGNGVKVDETTEKVRCSNYRALPVRRRGCSVSPCTGFLGSLADDRAFTAFRACATAFFADPSSP